MDLRSYIRFLRGSWLVVALFSLAGTLVGMAFVLSTTPKFAATAELFLTTPGYSSVGSLSTNTASPYQADAFSQQRAQSYVQLASRPDLARRVVDELGLNMRPEDLAKAISASVEPDTVLIDVTVKSASPSEAKTLADAVTAQLANDIRKLETPAGALIPVVDPVVTQPAETPRTPRDPNIAVYLVFSTAAGLLVGVTVALWLSRRRAVQGSQVERFTGRPVLGEVAVDEIDADRLASGERSISDVLGHQWRVIRRNVAFAMEDASNHVLAVTSPDGSPESSAAAAHLASAFARAGSRVALVVMEPNAHNYIVTKDCPPLGLAGAIAGEWPLAAIHPCEIENLYCVAGPGPENFTPLLQSVRFRGVVDQLRESFDLVIFDAPDFLQQAESTLLSEAVDSVILVVADNETDRGDLVSAVRLIAGCQAQLLGSIVKSASHRDFISGPQYTSVTLSRRPGQ
jgi:capsular polysaccharide biosynthesis protein